MKKLLTCVLVAVFMLLSCSVRPQMAAVEVTMPEETITLAVLAREEELGAAARALQARHGVRVELFEDSAIDLEAQLAAENAVYDVLCVDYSFGSLYTADDWLEKGYIAELERPVVKDAVLAMWPSLQNLSMKNGAVYSLPVAARPYVLNAWVPTSYEDWAALLNTEGFLLKDDGLVWACILEQYMLDAMSEDFSFDNEAFAQTLEYAKRAHNAPSANHCGVDVPRLSLGMTARIEQESLLGAKAMADRLGWLPSVDGSWRIPMKVSVLVIPNGAPHAQQAQDLLAQAAAMGLYGDLSEEGQLSFGGSAAAACYDRELQIACTVGEDVQNRQRWRQIMQSAAVTPQAGFLSECYVAEIGDYFDGKMDAQTCANAVQARWNARKMDGK